MKQRRASRRGQRKPFLSIRARLIVLALLAITPLIFDRIHGLELARDHRIEHARTRVIELAQRGNDSQRDVIASVRALVQIIGRLYAKMPADSASCNQYLTALTGNVPWIRGLSVAGTDGRIKCATDAQAVGLNFSDRPHFQSALRTKDFALPACINGPAWSPPIPPSARTARSTASC